MDSSPSSIKNEWIFGRAAHDLLWLYIPGFIGLILSILIPEDRTLIFGLFALISMGILDGGHVYSTVWRTYCNPTELRRSSMYIWVPIVLLALFTFLFLSGLYLKVSMWIVYARLHHSVQQFFGISKWHQRKVGVFRASSNRFLFLFCWFPVLISATRSEKAWLTLDVVHWPNQNAHSILTAFYFIAVAIWIIYEIKIWKSSKELGRVISIACPALLFSVAYMFSLSPAQVAIPICIAHAVAYFGLTQLALRKTDSPLIRPRWSPLLLFGFPAILGAVVFLATYGHIAGFLTVGSIVASTAFFCHQALGRLFGRAITRKQRRFIRKMVRREGVEPPTTRFVV